jgi:hypothetical protein
VLSSTLRDNEPERLRTQVRRGTTLLRARGGRWSVGWEFGEVWMASRDVWIVTRDGKLGLTIRKDIYLNYELNEYYTTSCIYLSTIKPFFSMHQLAMPRQQQSHMPRHPNHSAALAQATNVPSWVHTPDSKPHPSTTATSPISPA